MRYLLLILLSFMLFPVHASELVIEPGNLSYVSPTFSLHTKSLSFFFRNGNLRYGRTDLSPLSHTLENPHEYSLSTMLDAKDSVICGTRGAVYDTKFLDLSLSPGRTPSLALRMEHEKLSMVVNYSYVEGRKKKFFSPWKKSLDMDVITLGVMAENVHGVDLLSMISVSPDAASEMFTGLRSKLGPFDIGLYRGTLLCTRHDTRKSMHMSLDSEYGWLSYETKSGNRSFRPYGYREYETEMELGVKLGRLGFGRRINVTARRSGTRNEKRQWFLDTGFSSFTFVDGKVRFSMEPVHGISLGVGERGTRFTFRGENYELRYDTEGRFSFRCSVELP